GPCMPGIFTGAGLSARHAVSCLRNSATWSRCFGAPIWLRCSLGSLRMSYSSNAPARFRLLDAAGVLFGALGPAPDQRHVRAAFVHHALEPASVVSKHVAVIGREQHQSIARHAQLVQLIEQFADMVIDVGDG